MRQPVGVGPFWNDRAEVNWTWADPFVLWPVIATEPRSSTVPFSPANYHNCGPILYHTTIVDNIVPVILHIIFKKFII